MRHTPEFVQDRFIQVTPHFQYFVDTKHVLSTKHLECLGRLEKTVAVAKHLPPPLPTPLKNPNYGMLVSTEEEIITRAFKCNACGGQFELAPIEFLKHKKSCGKN